MAEDNLLSRLLRAAKIRRLRRRVATLRARADEGIAQELREQHLAEAKALEDQADSLAEENRKSGEEEPD